MEKLKEKYNIMVIGDEKVGKSTLLERHFNKKFNSERKKTIGVEYFTKDYTPKQSNQTFSLKFWDTAGQEKFRSVTKNYYQRAHGMIITLSIDNRTSFQNLKMWISSIFEHSGNPNIPLVVICNKTDLEEDRVVSNEEVEEVCKEEKLKVYFTSAKQNINIDEAFEYIIEKVIKANADQVKESGKALSDSNVNNSGSGGCCK